MKIPFEDEYQPKNDYDVTINAVKSVLQKYAEFENTIPKKTVFLGFDGYLDSLYSLVRYRESPEKWEKMESMKEFAARINDAAGSSCNVERVLKKNLAGGFAPNTGRAMSHMGVNVIIAGAMGYPNIHELFLQYPDNVEHYSITNPGTTAAYEFDDGKVMTTDFGNINGITWDLIIERISRDKFIELLERSDAIGQGHWALVPNMTNFWQRLCEDIFPNISNTKDKCFLVDAADMKKRRNKDIIDMLKMLQKVDEYMPAILAMNDKETADISRVLASKDSEFEKGRITEIKELKDYYDFGLRANEVLNLSGIITHDPHFATITTKNKHFWVTEGYTSKPKFTTAAGDHFTGGALVGLMCNLKPEEAIVIGNALTAIFVRTGVSVSAKQVKRFIDNYLDYVIHDIDKFSLN
ncbi:MAG: PfkB family carbohydrate kinase [Promethearchaeota archaeon]